MGACFLLPVSKNIFKRWCVPHSPSPLPFSLTFGRARRGRRSIESSSRRFLRLSFMCIVLPPRRRFPCARRHSDSHQTPHSATAPTPAARARPGRTPLGNICIMAADTYAPVCIQLSLSLKTKTTIVSRRCERGDGH